MAKLTDLLHDSSTLIRPGAIILEPMEGVHHPKFYVIAGISGNRTLSCSVLINSNINPFIQRRPNLLSLQMQISPLEYTFLEHESYINCARPLKGLLSRFNQPDFTYKAQLTNEHIELVQSNIKASGLLTPEEIKTFFE